MLLLIETIDAFVRGRALGELAEGEASRRYPLLTRVVFDAVGPHDPDRIESRFADGLERLLDGLAKMLPASEEA
jgi:hypothetical protein